jgi:hypothetical protein
MSASNQSGSPASDRIALAMTVRDEQSVLRCNLLYHHFLGVEHCFVYDDGSTDDTVASIADLPFVTVRPSVAPSEIVVTPELSKTAVAHKDEVMGRQMMNTAHAMAEARAAGFQWLVSLDADELVVLDYTNAAPGSLATRLGALSSSVDEAVFRTLEMVQRKLSYEKPMIEESLFKVANSGAMRESYDPFAQRVEKIPAVYGHRAGKRAVRLNIEAYPRIHRFLGPHDARLRAQRVGGLLHFFAADFATFLRKYRLMKDRPDRAPSGRTASYQMRLWRDVVNRSGLDDEGLRDYYEHWVMFSDDQLKRLKGRRTLLVKRRPVLVEVTSASDALRALGCGETVGAA